MNVRLESMCHGDGKIYLQMAIERMSAGSLLLLDARLKDGSAVPAHLFPFVPQSSESKANFVVVLPHFEVREIDLNFTEFNGTNEPLGQSRLTVETSALRWKTRFNALVRNELTLQMFSIEREYSIDRMNVFFTDAVDDGEEIVVKALIDMPHIEGVDVMVRFMDETGQELDLPVYPLIDEVVPAQRLGDEDRLHIGFSVRVNRTHKDFCVSVYDENDVLPGSFGVFSDETYEPLHENYVAATVDAGRDERYDDWYHYHCATLAELAHQRIARFPFEPTISLVMPFFPRDYPYISSCLEALSRQTYRSFELVVMDACGNENMFASFFKEWETDARLVRVILEEKTESPVASLTGIMQSKGEWCAILEPRVMLAPEALYEFVRAINEVEKEEENKKETTQTVTAIYSHHDHVSEQAIYSKACIKPEFSPDLLYSYNYLGPLVMYSREIIDKIAKGPGYSTESFSYDMALKAVECQGKFKRIEGVLYHVADLTAPVEANSMTYAEQEEFAFREGRKALAQHLRRQGVSAVVLSEAEQQRYRVKYQLPENHPTLSVVIPNKDQMALLDSCIASILQNEIDVSYEIVIVDNMSVLPETNAYYQGLVSCQPNVRIISYEGEFSISSMANYAFENTTSEYLLLLHNDTEFIGKEGMNDLLAYATRADVGIVGAKLLFSDDTVQHAGLAVGPRGATGNLGWNLPRSAQGYMKRLMCPSNVSAVSSACQLIKRSAFEAVGGYNEKFKLAYYDADLCLKLKKAGYRVVFDADVELYHHERATRGHSITHKDRVRLERERAYLHYLWPHYFIEGDPYLSSFFDSDSLYGQLAF